MPEAHAEDQSSAQRWILVVEDDAGIREALAMLLDLEGYEATLAASQEAALGLIQKHTYHLILSDLFASQPSEALDSARALRERAHPTPVGLLTGWPVDPAEVARLGFAFLLRKPFDLDDLLSQVAAAIHAPLTPEQQVQAETVRAYFETLSARDWDAFVALCTDDVVYALPGSSPFAGVIEGRASLRDYTARTFAQFPETRFEDVHIYAMPSGLAARYRSTWSLPDGGRASMTGAVIFQLAGTQIRRIGVRLDDARLTPVVGA